LRRRGVFYQTSFRQILKMDFYLFLLAVSRTWRNHFGLP
jgi:hypothetical protein